MFLAGVFGFSVTSLWCGLSQSGPELIAARLAQGATAALMVPQVLATLHLLFSDTSRGRAFGIYGIVLGLAGAAGFLLGGVLVTLDLAGLGWRAVFFVNVPFGLIIIAVALRIMPSVPRRAGTRLDVPGAVVLFAGLLCLIGPLLFGHDVHWAPWIWLVMAAGFAICLVVRPLLALVALAYVALTLSYTFVWRHILLLDLFAIAGTPEEVRERLERAVKTGAEEISMILMGPRPGVRGGAEQLTRFAETVMRPIHRAAAGLSSGVL